MHPVPDGAAVLRHLGTSAGAVTAQDAEHCARRATASALAHTRGHGFSARGDEVVAGELAAVILSCAVRAALNPESPLSLRDTPTACPGSFDDWNADELSVLARHRP